MEPEAYLQQYAEGLSPLKRYIDQLIAAETEETAIPETTAQGNPYQYWDYYNGYAYESAGQLKYWIEFRDEFYLHCLFRSGESEPYEEVYTLYPDWEAPSAQQLTIRTVKDENGNDITDRFVSLDFLFSSEDVVLMQVRRDEQTLAGGEEDNLLTGEYILKPREEQTPEQLCVLAQEYYKGIMTSIPRKQRSRITATAPIPSGCMRTWIWARGSHIPPHRPGIRWTPTALESTKLPAGRSISPVSGRSNTVKQDPLGWIYPVVRELPSPLLCGIVLMNVAMVIPPEADFFRGLLRGESYQFIFQWLVPANNIRRA